MSDERYRYTHRPVPNSGGTLEGIWGGIMVEVVVRRRACGRGGGLVGRPMARCRLLDRRSPL